MAIKAAERKQRDAQEALEQAELKLTTAQADSAAARESFNNWIATRSATQRGDQDPEVIKRTRGLDVLKQAERDAQVQLEGLNKITLDARQDASRKQEQLDALESTAREAYNAEQRKVCLLDTSPSPRDH
jgi:hypothetical protein